MGFRTLAIQQRSSEVWEVLGAVKTEFAKYAGVLGEARNLELQDVDLKARVLTIRGAKFGKTRLVPLHASTCTMLADYIARRQRHWKRRAVSTYLFVSNRGNRLDSGDIHRTFYALSRQIGLRARQASIRVAASVVTWGFVLTRLRGSIMESC